MLRHGHASVSPQIVGDTARPGLRRERVAATLRQQSVYKDIPSPYQLCKIWIIRKIRRLIRKEC